MARAARSRSPGRTRSRRRRRRGASSAGAARRASPSSDSAGAGRHFLAREQRGAERVRVVVVVGMIGRGAGRQRVARDHGADVMSVVRPQLAAHDQRAVRLRDLDPRRPAVVMVLDEAMAHQVGALDQRPALRVTDRRCRSRRRSRTPGTACCPRPTGSRRYRGQQIEPALVVVAAAVEEEQRLGQRQRLTRPPRVDAARSAARRSGRPRRDR